MNTYTNIRKLFAIRFAWCWRITPSATPRLRREDIDGAKGVFSASGQLRIILGTGTVNKVYDKFIAIFGLTAAAKEGLRAAAAAKQRPCPSGWSRLWAGVFVPVLPAIVASALSAPWASRSRPLWRRNLLHHRNPPRCGCHRPRRYGAASRLARWVIPPPVTMEWRLNFNAARDIMINNNL